MNNLVISHLHYPEIFLNGLTGKPDTPFEKQLNWEEKRVAIEQSRFDHQILRSHITSYRFDTSSKTKQYHTSGILEMKKYLIPAFRDSQPDTAKYETNPEPRTFTAISYVDLIF